MPKKLEKLNPRFFSLPKEEFSASLLSTHTPSNYNNFNQPENENFKNNFSKIENPEPQQVIVEIKAHVPYPLQALKNKIELVNSSDISNLEDAKLEILLLIKQIYTEYDSVIKSALEKYQIGKIDSITLLINTAIIIVFIKELYREVADFIKHDTNLPVNVLHVIGFIIGFEVFFKSIDKLMSAIQKFQETQKLTEKNLISTVSDLFNLLKKLTKATNNNQKQAIQVKIKNCINKINIRLKDLENIVGILEKQQQLEDKQEKQDTKIGLLEHQLLNPINNIPDNSSQNSDNKDEDKYSCSPSHLQNLPPPVADSNNLITTQSCPQFFSKIPKPKQGRNLMSDNKNLNNNNVGLDIPIIEHKKYR